MMSVQWVIRLSLVGVLAFLVLGAAMLLKDREKNVEVLENTWANLVFVVAYNVLCYLVAVLPPTPETLRYFGPAGPSLSVILSVVVGLSFVSVGASLMVKALKLRGVLGGQDTSGTLFTGGVYEKSRHPIYRGIVLCTLGLAVMFRNFDGLLAFPLVFLVNALQARLEERYDIIPRFGESYRDYRSRVRMFGPVWTWIVASGLALLPLGLSFVVS
ncbi:MAG: methyltransferase family protein [Promethearchaeota archaeon]